MSISKLFFFKRCAEEIERNKLKDIRPKTRGIYFLLLQDKTNKNKYKTLYIGKAGGDKAGMHGRLNSHKKSKRKNKPDTDNWTHFSIYEVWDNITNNQITEIEGFIRHIYRKDKEVNSLNQQRGFRKMRGIRNSKLELW